MWKKIILGVLFAGLIAVLLIGAVNRTNSQTRSSNDHSNDRNGEQTRDQSGQGNQGNGNGSTESASPVWETFQGVAIDITEAELLLHSASGDPLLIEGRAWSYAQEQGFSAYPNDQITVTGFYEGDEFVVGSITNTTSDQTLLIRDSGGRPLWAGRGKRD
jgi:hypothetical protein